MNVSPELKDAALLQRMKFWLLRAQHGPVETVQNGGERKITWHWYGDTGHWLNGMGCERPIFFKARMDNANSPFRTDSVAFWLRSVLIAKFKVRGRMELMREASRNSLNSIPPAAIGVPTPQLGPFQERRESYRSSIHSRKVLPLARHRMMA